MSFNIRIPLYAKSIVFRFYYLSFNVRIPLYAKSIIYKFYYMGFNVQILLCKCASSIVENLIVLIPICKFYYVRIYHLSIDIGLVY